MAKLEWDKIGERVIEAGVDRVVLYPYSGSAYTTGVAWSGVTGIDESPSGGEPTPMYADNIKYMNIISNEDFAATINAFTYPDEFAECDGSVEIAPGIIARQQKRKMFGLSYRTKLVNDTDGESYGYKIHLVYGCNAAPASRAHATINENIDGETMSWSVSTTPVEVPGGKATAHIEIDSTKVTPENLAKIEAKLYGGTDTEPGLPTPAELKALVAASGGVAG